MAGEAAGACGSRTCSAGGPSRSSRPSVLWLILVLTLLIVAETLLDRAGWLSDADRAWFAWADLAICSVLLAEFLLKLSLAPRKGLYFLRHFVIDFLASLPFGFLSYQIEAAQVEAGSSGPARPCGCCGSCGSDG